MPPRPQKKTSVKPASASVVPPQDEPMESRSRGDAEASEEGRVEVVVPTVHVAGAVSRSTTRSDAEVRSEVSAASSKLRHGQTELSLPDQAPVKRAKHDEPASVVDDNNMWQPEVNTPCLQCKTAKKGCQPPVARGKATACHNCARSKKLCSLANATPLSREL
ncbi:hypothetical protein PUNSTDRAFT_139614 [Punctularia strigosozonata HHB-11173 SS5]|uniref:Zn(2)-C6 fungal-type domain-containing protein n=1 Tax=Punctularia strigosozonata (strain HHB-11173) TaxID=741275 RepID=R7S298_PUNST|nr:uncharacterized protein PUNSTDRAFT_139614 [Punctularia strigosozonata HHB-11173 SS5]EIN03371.1 hypothetical protein PUNSTDRAFT_139614 [Punctularia strigosozonata HHB-11173 SS5]